MPIAALGVLALMLLVYYGQGLGFQVWPDSSGYLVQALGLVGHVPYVHSGDRTVGYPLFVALALATPWPALVLVVMQAIVAGLSFWGLYLGLTRLALPRLMVEATEVQRTQAREAVLLGVAAATLYSVVHVQIAALLTETLFTALVLAATLPCVWLVLPGQVMQRPWGQAALVAAAVALPVLVKPHWQVAAGLLGLVIGAALWRAVRERRTSGATRLSRLYLLDQRIPNVTLSLPSIRLGADHGGQISCSSE